MKPSRLKELAQELYQAMRNQTVLPPITEREADFTLADAYQVSLNFLQHRLHDGEQVIGKKIGLTSKVVQDMLGYINRTLVF